MAADELVRCRCCGGMFLATRPPRGPLAGYCSTRCRQVAYRDRVHLERVAEVADLALSCSHERLIVALAALSPSSVIKLRDLLPKPSDRNLSRDASDRLCSPDTPAPAGVVAGLHKEG